jgi:hypothetical protein
VGPFTTGVVIARRHAHHLPGGFGEAVRLHEHFAEGAHRTDEDLLGDG